jgi:YggT family protein
MVSIFVDRVLEAYMLMIMVWSFGSFFPQWRYAAWYKLLGEIVSPYLNLFRALPLRAGMMDFTPMVAIFVLILFRQLISGGRY